MHNALAVLASIFFLFSTCAAALPAPQAPQAPSSPTQHPIAPAVLATKCAFTLWHKQLLSPTADKANYIQINTLIDHANNISMDIAHLRPVGAFQSYSAVSAHRAFAIEGLLDGRSLSVSGGAGSDELVFASGGLEWRVESEGRAGGAEAWCEVEAWDGEIGEGKAGVRERRMECVFPCEKIEEDEKDEKEQDRVELR